MSGCDQNVFCVQNCRFHGSQPFSSSLTIPLTRLPRDNIPRGSGIKRTISYMFVYLCLCLHMCFYLYLASFLYLVIGMVGRIFDHVPQQKIPGKLVFESFDLILTTLELLGRSCSGENLSVMLKTNHISNYYAVF